MRRGLRVTGFLLGIALAAVLVDRVIRAGRCEPGGEETGDGQTEGPAEGTFGGTGSAGEAAPAESPRAPGD